MASKIVHEQPTIFIIFGATGDLSWRKLAPALYNLYLDKFMPHNFAIIGNARAKMTNEEFQGKMLEGVNQFSRNGKADKAIWKDFAQHISYQSSDVQDNASYKSFADFIEAFESKHKSRSEEHTSELQSRENIV